MNTKTKNAILISLGISTLCAAGAYYVVANSHKPVPMVEVAMATKEIKAGDVFTEDNYQYVAIPQSEYSSSYVTKVKMEATDASGKTVATLTDTLKGKEVVSDIYPNEKVMKGRVSGTNALTDDKGKTLDLSQYRKMTISVSDVQSLSGQVQAGDKVDFWVTYKLTDKTTNDKLEVVDKILKSVIINKTFDGSGNEIVNGNGIAKTVEVLLTEKELQKYLEYKDLGKYTLVKVPSSSSGENSSDEIVRMKLSTNNLIWEIASMTDDKVTADKIEKDPSKEKEIQKYVMDENSDSSTSTSTSTK